AGSRSKRRRRARRPRPRVRAQLPDLAEERRKGGEGAERPWERGRRVSEPLLVKQDEIRSRREVFAHFLPDVRKRRGKLAAGIAFALIYALARVVEPWPLKVVFDQVLFNKPAHGLTARPFTFLGSSANELLAAAAIVLMVASLVRGVSYYYED